MYPLSCLAVHVYVCCIIVTCDVVQYTAHFCNMYLAAWNILPSCEKFIQHLRIAIIWSMPRKHFYEQTAISIYNLLYIFHFHYCMPRVLDGLSFSMFPPTHKSPYILYARQKNNPLGKIRYLWNFSRYIHQICKVNKWGFIPYILHILLKYHVAHAATQNGSLFRDESIALSVPKEKATKENFSQRNQTKYTHKYAERI